MSHAISVGTSFPHAWVTGSHFRPCLAFLVGNWTMQDFIATPAIRHSLPQACECSLLLFSQWLDYFLQSSLHPPPLAVGEASDVASQKVQPGSDPQSPRMTVGLAGLSSAVAFLDHTQSS